MTSALLTDHYELTMVQAAMDAGTANRRSLFDLFTRRLPEGRRYGVVAGLGRVIDAIENFTFSEAELAFNVKAAAELEKAGLTVFLPQRDGGRMSEMLKTMTPD